MAAKAAAPAKPSRGTKVTVGFGLVNVPVAFKPLYDTVTPIAGKTLCPDHLAPLNQRWICCAGTEDEHLLLPGETCRGYPVPGEDGRFVVLDDAVLDELVEERTGRVEITQVVPDTEIGPELVDKTYLAWPGDGGDDAFDLLTTVLREDRVAAVGTTVLQKQTVLFVLRWSHELDCAVAHTLRFVSRRRDGEIALARAGRKKPSAEMLDMARQLLVGMAGTLDANDVDDTYTPLLENAVKLAAGKGGTPTKKPVKKEAPVGDLMAALQASVQQPAKKPARKKVSA